MSDGGKGSRMRSVDLKKYNENFDLIFNKKKVRVSGVPYEVELETKTQEINSLIGDIDDLVAELERENFMLRARIDRMEEELKRYEDDGK